MPLGRILVRLEAERSEMEVPLGRILVRLEAERSEMEVPLGRILVRAFCCADAALLWLPWWRVERSQLSSVSSSGQSVQSLSRVQLFVTP